MVQKRPYSRARAARRRERSLGRIGTILGSTDMSTTPCETRNPNPNQVFERVIDPAQPAAAATAQAVPQPGVEPEPL
eukprot:scaffold38863_cov63-Phaeocystis_antarctica.AAC.3